MRSLNYLLVLLALWGCNQNPYPDEGEVRETPREQRRVRLALSADIPQELYLFEGVEHEEKLKVKVPPPGHPVVWIDGLPDGAEFDAETYTLKWRPGFFAGNNSQDPTIKTRVYPLTVWLKSSLDDTEKISQRVSVIVTDVPRAITIDGNQEARVDEGATLSYEFEVDNADYPQGPFSIFTSDMPSNTKIEAIPGTSNKFKLQFSPDYFHVNARHRDCGSWQNSCRKYEGKITVTNPAGHQQEKDLTITVNDKRLGSKIVTPATLNQGLDVSFQVTAYDLNKEISPVLRLLGQKPTFGKFETKTIASDENNSTILDVKWSDIPPIHNGKTFTFKFESCVANSQNNLRDCTQDKIDINIRVKKRPAPIIDRSNWNVGQLMYLGHNESKLFRVKVEDAEMLNSTPMVEIFPESIRKYVSWKNNQLLLRFNEAGVFQFNLVATSDYNIQSSQSFIVEVFPQNRSKVLFFADSTKDKEVQFYQKTYPGLDLMNPVIQEINTRNISARDTLIIGTSILKDLSVNEKIIKAMDFIDNIVIASPLLENLPEKYLRELNQDYGVVFYRYQDLSSAEDLTKMHLDGMNIYPQQKVRLGQNASDESVNPLIFNTKSSSSNCKPVLDLMNDIGSQIHKIGIVCKRKTGGRLALMGTEWADLKTSSADSEIPASWMKRMLTISVRNEKE